MQNTNKTSEVRNERVEAAGATHVGAQIATHVGVQIATHVGAQSAGDAGLSAGTFVALEVSYALIAALREIVLLSDS